jgi:hypothetical protein
VQERSTLASSGGDPKGLRFEAPRHSRTREFPESIPPNPACRGVLRIRQSPRDDHGRGIERAIAFADRAQGHVGGLLDNMAFVTRFAFDEGEALFKEFIASRANST